MSQSAAFHDHEQVVFANDPATGLRAVIVIHNTSRGPAFGGCRMKPYENMQAALDDALKLSRAMTYKAAICELPFGGGKSVILGDPKTDKTPELLRAMGRFVNSLNGRYLMADDVGTTVRDMALIREVSPHARGMADAAGEPTPATACGVFMALSAAVACRFGSTNLNGLTVAVQGLGSVGARLCGYLAGAGAKLVVADTNPRAVARVATRHQVRVVAPDEIYGAQADVFSPCALGGVLNPTTIDGLYAPIVVGAANNQLASADMGDVLKEAGILYVPDYVANAGGVIDIAHEGPGYDPRQVLKDCERLFAITTEVLARAAAQGQATNRVADRMAEERFTLPDDRQAA